VDDDHGHISLIEQPLQHRLQLRPVRRSGGLTDVYVLVGHDGTHCFRLPDAGLPLGRDREPLSVDVSLGLLAGGDPQIDNGLDETIRGRRLGRRCPGCQQLLCL